MDHCLWAGTSDPSYNVRSEYSFGKKTRKLLWREEILIGPPTSSVAAGNSSLVSARPSIACSMIYSGGETTNALFSFRKRCPVRVVRVYLRLGLGGGMGCLFYERSI